MKKNIIFIIIILAVVIIIEIILLLNEVKKYEINNTIKDVDINITVDNSMDNTINIITNNISDNTMNNTNTIVENTIKNETGDKNQVTSNNIKTNLITDEWNLKLVNYENSLPIDFKPNLSNIDSTRKFDSRAIGKLKQMINNMKKDNVKDIWIQSSYRSIEQQQIIFNKKVNEYINNGKSAKEAEMLTLKTINKPGTSEHNLGLAVDFNYVNLNFEKTKAFAWLKENAEDYGFILRYPKEKEQITKVNYEPWHWRYVGEVHAKKMNDEELCLEEYIKY